MQSPDPSKIRAGGDSKPLDIQVSANTKPAVQRRPPESIAREKDDREFGVAKDVLEAMAKLHAGNPPSAEDFADFCEISYRWMMSESWQTSKERTGSGEQS